MQLKSIKELELESSPDILKQYYSDIYDTEKSLKTKVREIYLSSNCADKIKADNGGTFPDSPTPGHISGTLFLCQDEFDKNYGIIMEQDFYSLHLNKVIQILKNKKIQIPTI